MEDPALTVLAHDGVTPVVLAEPSQEAEEVEKPSPDLPEAEYKSVSEVRWWARARRAFPSKPLSKALAQQRCEDVAVPGRSSCFVLPIRVLVL